MTWTILSETPVLTFSNIINHDQTADDVANANSPISYNLHIILNESRTIKQKVLFFSTKRKVYINYNRDFFLIQIPQIPQEKEW